MGKLTIGICCIVGIIIGGMALNVWGDESEETMCLTLGTITLAPPEGVEAQKSPVEFPHGRHFATECKSCHHKWQGEGKIKGCMTSGCHDQITAPDKPMRYLSYSNTAIKYYKYAYHKMCVGCHKEIKERNMALELSRVSNCIVSKSTITKY